MFMYHGFTIPITISLESNFIHGIERFFFLSARTDNGDIPFKPERDVMDIVGPRYFYIETLTKHVIGPTCETMNFQQTKFYCLTWRF